ncbi:transcriptional regulator [Neisseria meningitidis]|uniref:Uncharacterized protein n=5 Tax=Neisseria TaxID=482 RepID=A0A378W1U5_NEIGO|nr:transcriptional regulator [Neisseria meningitidis LNP21362]ARB68486.1 transcriptional regulator [Neisseria meningitidis]ARC02631.1 transcriptional regulator [Neisseria gonorrhoeae]EEZ74404.1 hypothetical protein NEILACOT_05581 [Neisseria lactamica ATCC 23970]EOB89753.1 putative identified by MetaGeneAnnotator [Neisseria meningitidis NM607]EOC05121.1 putative identified by MetaGeneAnnotator [Neisseria meningitidis NM95]EQD23604.1 putative identified by MetaGeneAnnotator [Neisseria meningiti
MFIILMTDYHQKRESGLSMMVLSLKLGEKLSSYELESKKHKKEFQKGGAKDFLTEVFMM